MGGVLAGATGVDRWETPGKQPITAACQSRALRSHPQPGSHRLAKFKSQDWTRTDARRIYTQAARREFELVQAVKLVGVS
jgi:hypothetical protein